MNIGKINRMRISRIAPMGLYLKGDATGDVLLPGRYVPEGVHINDELEVFLYLDQDERVIATTQTPKAMVGDFAYLEVAWVNNYGAFLDWGLMKDLFVPFREQKMKMQQGQSYIVHVHLDPETGRIMASAKIERYLQPGYFHAGQEVDLLVWQKTDLGFKVIVDNIAGGLLYDNEVFTQLHTGDRVKGYIRQVRPDGKIDVSLQQGARATAVDFADTLLEHLRMNGGSTSVNDHSAPEEIYAMFGVSKKVFKQAVGKLYKEHLITIESDRLVLVK